MLGKIISGSGVLFVPLGKGETFEQRDYSSRLSIPLCFAGKIGGSRRMDLSPCSENTSVFTSPSSIAAEHMCFPSCYQTQLILCHQLREVEEWVLGRDKCLATRQGTGTYSIFFNSNKKVTPCRGEVLLPMIVQCCGNAHPY